MHDVAHDDDVSLGKLPGITDDGRAVVVVSEDDVWSGEPIVD
jgi:hypothetical protein